MSPWVVVLAATGCGAKSGVHGLWFAAGPDASTDAAPEAGVDAIVSTADLCVELPRDGEVVVPLEFVVAFTSAEIVLLVDTTGSMTDEIDQIRETLLTTIVPSLAARLPVLRVAVAGFQDFPYSTYGGMMDRPFELLAPLTDDQAAIERTLGFLEATPYGGDPPEAAVEALYQVATGEGIGRFVPAAACTDGGLGYPCFTQTGARVVLLFTDAPFHNGPGASNAYSDDLIPSPHTYGQAVEALGELEARVLGVSSSVDSAVLRDISAVAEDTGAIGIDGLPIAFTIGADGSGLSTAVVDAVETLIDEVPIDITLEATDRMYLRAVRAASVDPPSGATIVGDRFDQVRPGSRIVYELVFADPGGALGDPGVPVRLEIRLIADGVTELLERTIDLILGGDRCPD